MDRGELYTLYTNTQLDSDFEKRCIRYTFGKKHTQIHLFEEIFYQSVSGTRLKFGQKSVPDTPFGPKIHFLKKICQKIGCIRYTFVNLGTQIHFFQLKMTKSVRNTLRYTQTRSKFRKKSVLSPQGA